MPRDGRPAGTRIDWDDLRGVTALITGASSGIGAEFATAFAARGADLVLVARRRDALERTAEVLRRDLRIRVEVIAADLAAPDAPQRVVAATSERGLDIDVLLNNAGAVSSGPVSRQDFAEQHRIVAVNATAVADLTNLLLPPMVRRGRGAVVTVASGGAFRPTAGMAVYAASKAFALSFTEALWGEQDLAESGIQVMAVAPGPTRTAAVLPGVRRPAEARDVVAASFRGFSRGSMTVIHGGGNRRQVALLRLLPRRLAVQLIARATARLEAGPDRPER